MTDFTLTGGALDDAAARASGQAGRTGGYISGMSPAGAGAAALGSVLRSDVPKAVLIRSAVQRVKQRIDAARDRYQTESDIPSILAGIKRSDEEAALRQTRIEGLLAGLSQPPPEAPTAVRPTLGEGLGGLLATVLGADPQAVSTSVGQIAGSRQAMEAENAARAYGSRQAVRARRFEVETARAASAEREALRLRDTMARLKQRQSDVAYDAEVQVANADIKSALTLADQMAKRQIAQDEQEHEAALQRFKAEADARAKAADAEGRRVGERARALMETARRLEDPGSLKAAVAGLREMGYNVTVSEERAMLGLAEVNRRRREHEERMEAAGLALQRESVRDRVDNTTIRAFESGLRRPGATSLPGSIPGAGFEPMEVAVPDGLLEQASEIIPGLPQRPSAGQAEQDFQQLMDTVADVFAARETLANLRRERDERLKSVRGGSGLSHELASQALVRDIDADIRKVEAGLTKSGETLRSRRSAVNARATPQFRQWRIAARQAAKAQIASIMAEPDSEFSPAFKKAEADKVRDEFERLTGERL